MVFTYFLRGIDLPTIFFVIALNFVAVMVSVQIAVFLAVVPANRVLKGLLGLLGLVVLFFLFVYTVTRTVFLIDVGLPTLLEDSDFAVGIPGMAMVLVAFFGLLFAWSVALLHPASANRALPVRAFLLLLCPVTGVLCVLWSRSSDRSGLFFGWIVALGILCTLSLIIAVSEREQWGPRMARSIPRRWWLRWPAFLLFSGAAGGVLFALLLFALTALGVRLHMEAFPSERAFWDFRGALIAVDERQILLEMMGVMVLYTYCYAMTAAWLRRVFLPRVPGGYTWIILIVLVTAGCVMPFLLSFLLLNPGAPYAAHVPWLLPDPGVAMSEFSGPSANDYRFAFLGFACAWAGLITLLSVPWFVRQIRGFRPFAGGAARSQEPPTLTIPPEQLDVTKTEP
jgi:hypothetical protein